jgi:hypothetical protein
MVKCLISVYTRPINDTTARMFGLAIDQPLNPDFWTSQPEKVLKTPDGSPLLRNKEFLYEITVDLPEGKHTLSFAPSSPEGYTWEARAFLGGLFLGKASDVTASKPLTVEFEVTQTTAEKLSAALASTTNLTLATLTLLPIEYFMIEACRTIVKRR